MRPAPHSSIELRDLGGTSYAAEVAFVTEGYVATARPASYPADQSPSGEQFELVWPVGEAVNIQPVAVTERPGRGAEVIWEAVATGDIRTEERRPRARVHLHTLLTMVAGGSSPLETTEAMLTDLSENSLRAGVYGREWSGLEPGTPIHVGFVADNTYFDVTGAVLRTHASEHEDDDGVEVIVLLDADEQTTEDLRRAVMAEREVL